jgi:hypothetical protein
MTAAVSPTTGSLDSPSDRFVLVTSARGDEYVLDWPVGSAVQEGSEFAFQAGVGPAVAAGGADA